MTEEHKQRNRHLMKGLGGLNDILKRMQARKEKENG